MLFGAGIWLSNFCRTVSGAAASLLNYIINGKTPDLVADFNGSLNDGTEFYNAGGTVDTFAELITHSRAGNATMTDGYGPELVTNGTFNNSDGWSTGAGWEISNGQANRITGAYSELLYTFPSALQAGKTYTIEFTAPISGVMAIGFIGPIVTSAYATRSGATAITLTATGSHTGLRFLPGGPATDGAIDNVSVREMPAIKWAPHNLLTYSEDFTNAAWTKFGTSSITGTKTINFPAVDDRIYQSWSSVVGDVDTFGAILSGSGTVTIHLASGGINSSTQITLTSTPTLYSVSGTATISATGYVFIRRNAGDTATSVVCDGVTRYRSDLGGMVDNPETGDSYVPTTSSAVYLPRRNHHVYNGDAWVNEGVLHESEARTNLVTYSNDFNESIWGKYLTAVSANVAVSPDGTTNADLVYPSSSGTANSIYRGGLPTSQKSHSYVVKAAGFSWFCILDETTSAGIAWFNLATGDKGSVAANTVSFMENLGNGWYRCSAYKTASYNQYTASGPVDGDNSITVTKNGTDGIYYYHAQVELGAMASSIIPTSDSTVSRALETLTIPAANMPWPEPNYIGPELVVNGTFDSASDWVTSGNVAISSGVAVFGSGTTAVQGLVQNIGLVGGKVYQYSFDVSGVTGGEYLRVKFGEGGDSFIVAIAGTKTGIIVSSGGTANIDFRPNTTLTTSNITLDNISVREIDPLAVSIQMQGRMTYADTGNAELTFFDWRADSYNYIQANLRTQTTATGEVYHVQAAASVTDDVDGRSSQYTPGVFVPFNTASRHGSTFINGAVDGVALTADTTPLALPDLSATDFNLGHDYMGTISMFRVWADDLADAGIAEATEPSEVPSLQLTFDNSETSFTIQDWEQ